MSHESTTDFAYLRSVLNNQLEHSEKAEALIGLHPTFGAPIALFTMLWIEGYINHLIAVLFPHNFVSTDAKRVFQKNNRGTKEKFKYLTTNLGLNSAWPKEFAQLLKFRNRVCHAMVVETDIPDIVDVPTDPGFVDSFESCMGTMEQIKERHAFTVSFLEGLYDSIKDMNPFARQALIQRLKDNTTEYRLANFQAIKHPVYAPLSIQVVRFK